MNRTEALQRGQPRCLERRVQYQERADAYQRAIRSAGQNDKILVFGSFYTVGAVLAARG